MYVFILTLRKFWSLFKILCNNNKFEVDTKMLDLSTKQKDSVSLFLFEGDIFLSEQQATNILSHLENNRTARSLSSELDALWDSAKFPIKYRFHESIGLAQVNKLFYLMFRAIHYSFDC